MIPTFAQKPTATTPFTPIPQPILQRKCACGGTPGPSGECESCRRKREQALQRSALDAKPVKTIPPIVQDVLNSPGQPLDPGARALTEPSFGHDFSLVRVHSDTRAARSADAVNALAYTVGNNIVFAAGQYNPHTNAGQSLLTHELTHVAQQQAGAGQNQFVGLLVIGQENSAAEAEAARNASQVMGARPITVGAPVAGGVVQRQPSPIDATAQAIITAAADATRAIAVRAVDVVQQIINQYFPTDASKVSSIVYNQATIGLSTTYTGTGATLTGIITVGDQFVNGATRTHFARRVAQVGHEIEHVGQQRAGMGGANRSDEREYLAFYHEALFVVKPGTGSMQHSMRVSLIDAALGYYYCLSAALQTQYDSQKQELLTRRATEMAASGNPATTPPTTCRRQ